MAKKILEDVVRHIEEDLKKGHKTRVFFDLDSTLFNVKPRHKVILNESADEAEFAKKYPEAVEVLKEVKDITVNSYYLKDHLKEIGLTDFPKEFYKELYQFWKKRFFHNDYLEHDVPMPGAVDFVNELNKMGAHILY